MNVSKQIFNVRVIPRAKQNKIVVMPDGVLRVYTTAAPTDGDANAAVIKMLAAHFDVPKTGIKIVRGQTCRDKIIEL